MFKSKKRKYNKYKKKSPNKISIKLLRIIFIIFIFCLSLIILMKIIYKNSFKKFTIKELTKNDLFKKGTTVDNLNNKTYNNYSLDSLEVHIKNKLTQFENKPKISIILPIFNKENFLNRSISSIQKQTLKNIEIIAVNDNSIDKTFEVLMNLSNNDSRIKIINNERNRGPLYSRAMGILNSKGEYIMTIDPDDELEGPDNLEYLYNMTNNSKIDIICFSYLNRVKNKKNYIKKTISCSNFNKILYQPELFYLSNKNGDLLIVNKMVKKEIYLKAFEDFKKVIYEEKIIYADDEIWVC